MMSEAGERLLEGALEALEFAKGKARPGAYKVHFPEACDISSLRRSMNMTVAEFADYFGLDEQTVIAREAEATKDGSAFEEPAHHADRIPDTAT